MERYAGAVKLVFKHFPISTIHPNAETAGLAVECAGEQGKFWEFWDILYVTKAFDPASLASSAEWLELDVPKFTACLSDKRYQDRLFQDYADGAALGVRGTPTFFINGKELVGPQDYNEFKRLIK